VSDRDIRRVIRASKAAGVATHDLVRDLCSHVYLANGSLSFKPNRVCLSLEEAYTWIESRGDSAPLYMIELMPLAPASPPGEWRVLVDASGAAQGSKWRESGDWRDVPSRHVGTGRSVEEACARVVAFRDHQTRVDRAAGDWYERHLRSQELLQSQPTGSGRRHFWADTHGGWRARARFLADPIVPFDDPRRLEA